MAHVDLCSGIGGFALGFEWAGLSKPVLFCDIEPWSRKILKKHWPDVPQCEDVKELANDPNRYVSADLDWSNTILTAGYPCQPFSVAGRQRGTEDPRHIWPWLLKLVALKRPKFAVFENVNGHIALGLDKVLNDLEGEDYAVTTLIIPASAVGAPHKRERLWIIAKDMGNSQHNGSSTSKIKGSNQENARRSTQGAIKAEQSQRASGRGHDEDVSNTQSARAWQNDSGLRQGAEGIDRGQGTDVADTQSGGRRELQVSGKKIRNAGCKDAQSIFTGPIQSNVADTDSKRGCSRNTEGQDAEDVRQSPRSQGQDTRRMAEGQPQSRMGDLADGLSKGLDRFGKHDGFEVEPSDIPRVASGIKDRANRLKGLGNAIVPQIAMQIGLAIKETQWK